VSVVEEVGVSPVVVATAVVEVLAGSPVELPVLGSATTSSPQAAAARQQEAVRRPVRVLPTEFHAGTVSRSAAGSRACGLGRVGSDAP
jgi:hypothetical protein